MKPSRRAARKRSGGRAMTPAVPVLFICCTAVSIPMAAPTDLRRRGEVAAETTTRVSFLAKLTTKVSTRKIDAANGLIEMASARHGKRVEITADSKREAIAELMLEVAQCFFRIRAVGQKTGFITSWGGGAFGV